MRCDILNGVLLFGNFREHLQALFHQILLDHPQDLVLLEGLTGDVQRQILRIHHALHKVQPLRHELIAVVHDEDSAHVQLDVVALLLGLEEIKRRATGHKEQGPELQLTLDAEVLHCKVVLPVVGQRLVEARVLLVGDVFRLAHPQRLVLVQLLPLMRHLLHFLRLLPESSKTYAQSCSEGDG